MQRYCVCGQKIKLKQELCAACYAEYGQDRAQWPEWLQDWIKSAQNELNDERNHLEYELHDETKGKGVKGTRKSRVETEKGSNMTYDPKTCKFESDKDVMALAYPGSPWDNTRINQRSMYDDSSLEGMAAEAQSAAIWSRNGAHGFNTLIDRDLEDEDAEWIDVTELIDRLPEREGIVAEMLQDGKKEREIADELGITQQAVSKIRSKIKLAVVKWRDSCSNKGQGT